MNERDNEKLYHKALMGRSMVLNLIGECDRAIEGQKRAIRYFRTRVADDSPLILSLMIELAHILVDRKCDYEQGEEIAKHVLSKAKESKDAKLHGDAVAMIALIALNRSKYKMALKYYEKLLKIFEETSQRDKLCIIYNRIGKIYLYCGNFEKSLEFHSMALKLSKRLGYKRGIEISCNNIGLLKRTSGDFEGALKYFNQYLTIAKETGNKIGVGIVSSNIGTVYNSLGEYDIALKYFDVDLALAREIGDKFGVAVAHNNMANSYAYKKDFPRALKCFKKYLTLSEEIGYERGIGIATYNIAGIYTDMKKYDDAEQYFLRAENILSRTGDKLALIATYINVSEMNERRNRGIKAVKAAEKALRLSESLGAEVHRVYSLRAMGRALALQDVQKARSYLKKALTRAKKGRLTREIALLESDLLEIQKKTEPERDSSNT